MVVTSEIENNADFQEQMLLGIKETGSAMILDESGDSGAGFGRFLFKHFTEYIDVFTSQIGQSKGKSFLEFIKQPNIENIYLDCIAKTVQELLSKEGLSLAQIKTIFPPQISSEFISDLSKKINLIKEKFVDLAQDGKDFLLLLYPILSNTRVIKI